VLGVILPAFRCPRDFSFQNLEGEKKVRSGDSFVIVL
jgi:hypothetical protein